MHVSSPKHLIHAATFLAALTGAANLASAHPWFVADKANPGTAYSSIINIPHGCDENGTIKITMKMPEGVTDPKGEDQGKWKASSKTTATGASLVIWEGGLLPTTQNGEFKVSFKIGDVKPGKIIYFPLIQNCEKGGSYRWIEFPTKGVDEYDLETPAPLIEIVAGEIKKSAPKKMDAHGKMKTDSK